MTTPSASPVSEASDLCLGCGLCCTGVLYMNVRAQPEEVPQLRAAGLEVEQSADGLRFLLPCPHHHGRCSIYDDRFQKCRSFRCALLKRLDAGQISLTEAQRTVKRGKAMLASLIQEEPQAESLRFRVDLRRGAPPTREAGARAAGLWVRSLAFDKFLDSWFRNRPIINPAAEARVPETEE